MKRRRRRTFILVGRWKRHGDPSLLVNVVGVIDLSQNHGPTRIRLTGEPQRQSRTVCNLKKTRYVCILLGHQEQYCQYAKVPFPFIFQRLW